jgi:hypothetical protein
MNGPGPRFNASVSPVMESVVVAEAAEGVKVGGLKAQEAPLGNPLQAKFTVELKPFWGVTVKVTAPCPPDETISEEGDALNVKLGGDRLIVYEAVAIALFEYPFATAMASIVSVAETVIAPL